MKRTWMIIVLMLMLAVGIGGCATKAKPAKKTNATENEQKVPVPKSHSIKKTDERRLMKQTRENLEIIMAVRDDTATLEKALSGQALKQMSKQVAGEKANNLIKVRQYDNIRLSMGNVTKGIAGLELKFTDNTVVKTADTGRVLENAPGREVEFLLAAKKIKGRWRIIEIFSKDLKP